MTQDLTALRNRPAVLSHLKKNCPELDLERVFISHKNGSEYFLVVSGENGKLIVKEFYDGKWSLNLLIPKINEYLRTGHWVEDNFYQPYTNPNAMDKNEPFGPVIRIPSDKSFPNLMTKFRALHSTKDIGFEQVPPTDSAVVFLG